MRVLSVSWRKSEGQIQREEGMEGRKDDAGASRLWPQGRGLREVHRWYCRPRQLFLIATCSSQYFGREFEQEVPLLLEAMRFGVADRTVRCGETTRFTLAAY